MADSSSPQTYTLAEIAEHNTADDCWLLLNGKVYDVTTFLQDHPGGEDIIVENGGHEATEEFEDIGHSQSARDLLPKYEIGLCSEVDPKAQQRVKEQVEFCEPEAKQGSPSMLRWTLPVLFLVVAILYGYMTTQPKAEVN